MKVNFHIIYITSLQLLWRLQPEDEDMRDNLLEDLNEVDRDNVVHVTLVNDEIVQDDDENDNGEKDVPKGDSDDIEIDDDENDFIMSSQNTKK